MFFVAVCGDDECKYVTTMYALLADGCLWQECCLVIKGDQVAFEANLPLLYVYCVFKVRLLLQPVGCSAMLSDAEWPACSVPFLVNGTGCSSSQIG